MLAYIIPDITTALTDHINRFGVVKILIFHFENWNSKHIIFTEFALWKVAQTKFPKLGKTWENKFLQK